MASLESESAQLFQSRHFSEASVLLPSVTPVAFCLTGAGCGQTFGEGVPPPFLGVEDILYTMHMLRC